MLARGPCLLLWLFVRPILGAVQLDKLHLPPGFQIEQYASIPAARSLAVSQNTSAPWTVVYVGTKQAGGAAQKVYAVVDDKSGGVRRVVTLTPQLDQPNGVAWRNGSLYVAEMTRILRYDNADSYAVVGRPLPAPAVVSTNLPRQPDHGWRYIKFGTDGRLYVPIGSPCDDCSNSCPPFGSLQYCTMTVMNADGSNHQVFAKGLRNVVGLDFQPGSGALFFTENAANDRGDSRPDDFLGAAPAPGLDFGFPRCQTVGEGPDQLRNAGPGKLEPATSQTGAGNCTGVGSAVQALGPHVAPLGMAFYTGSAFPPEYHNSIFVAQHGSWVRSAGAGMTGYNVVRVRLDAQGRSAALAPFVWGWLPADNKKESIWGRPVDVQQLPDGSLLISDDFANAIWRVSYIGAPGSANSSRKGGL